MNRHGFLTTGKKDECTGCEACIQMCSHSAIRMVEDKEGFRYPAIDETKCVGCDLCRKVCPEENPAVKHERAETAFGGYIKNVAVRQESTSGGAFSAIAEAFCDENYVIFGAVADGLEVRHAYITDKSLLGVFRKSKYSQSKIGTAYKDVRRFLKEGKKVLFSGTPCQISGCLNLLDLLRTDRTRLLTVEVVCEGVPSPLYIRKYNEQLALTKGAGIANIDYRDKDTDRWDFQVMTIGLKNGKKYKKDRWFNPFWSIWLRHLMSRPSCYRCQYATPERTADITLGDLWGVHLYCPQLYGRNTGASLIVPNTETGKKALDLARRQLYGEKLDFSQALKYQGPMRNHISMNPDRNEFMSDLENPSISITEINRRWAKRPTLKLLFSKYIWGNRQKVALWNLKHRLTGKKRPPTQ